MLRAKDNQDKLIRKESICTAAYNLFIKNNYTLPSVNEIAQKTGIAKGTIYIYFGSREEIYIRLLDDMVQQWLTEIESVFKQPTPTVEMIITAICAYLTNNPHFLPLLSILNTILEKNLDDNMAYNFKRQIAQKLNTISATAVTSFENIPPETIGKLLLQGYGLIIGLWQVTNFPEKIRNMLHDDELLILNLNFETEIKLALTALWNGTLMNNKEHP